MNPTLGTPVSTLPAAVAGPAGRLTVCHVSLTLCTGGLERLLADFARFHDRDRYRLLFVAMKQIGRFADDIREQGCEVHGLASAGRVGQILELRRLLRQQRVSVVHTHNTYPHLYATIAARLARVPVVVHTRHGQGLGQGPGVRRQVRWMSRWVDRMVAVSRDAARLFRDADGIAGAKIQTIWNGIDTDSFEYRGPVRQPIGICVARLSKEKDISTLLRAIPRVLEEVPGFRLQLVGDGEERPLLESLARGLGAAHAVQFLGMRTDVSDLLSQAGLFISSSASEGISLTLLEAMAVGLPVIATDVGGNPEVVEHGRTGWVVPPARPEALATAIIEQCRRMDQWSAVGLRGRQRVEEHFDIRRMVSDYEQLYAALLRQKTGSVISLAAK